MQQGSPARVQVVVPFHQPLRASEAELEQAWNERYAPLLERLQKTNAKIAVHFSGHLLDYLARRREDALIALKRLAKAQRIEVLGGLFYGGVPALLSELDVRGQVQMMSEFWESALGWAPQGFFLPELAWSVELPRLLQDTGLSYGFVSSSQVTGPAHDGLGLIERGEQRVAAFVLDRALSQVQPSRPVDEWVDAVLDRASQRPGGVTNVWLRAEVLAGADPAWTDSFFQALSSRQDMTSVLPSEVYPAVRPVIPLRLSERIAPELGFELAGREVAEWSEFVRGVGEVSTLHRRMQRTSDKLKDAIATMEDEELDETWSDALATAQRLVFSAQAIDGYVMGRGDAEERAAAMARLVRAEATIDALVQGEEDWIATEEGDLDGDLVDEVFVCTRRLTAWVLPGQAGRVRALDDRLRERSLIDAARSHAAADSERGIREWVLGERATAAEFFSSSLVEVAPRASKVDVGENRIDEEGDCNYHLRTTARLPVSGAGEREVTIDKHLVIPIDAGELRLEYKVGLSGGSELTVATELPLQIGAPTAVVVNGEAVEGLPKELSSVSTLRVETEVGGVELELKPAAEVWIGSSEGGVVLVPALRVAGTTELVVTMRLLGEEPVAEEEEAVEEEETVEEEEEVVEEEEASDDDTMVN